MDILEGGNMCKDTEVSFSNPHILQVIFSTCKLPTPNSDWLWFFVPDSTTKGRTQKDPLQKGVGR